VLNKGKNMEIVIYYVIPNVLLFGSIYLAARYVENSTQDFINNYAAYQQKLVDFMRKIK
jgi:hypothetical protein